MPSAQPQPRGDGAFERLYRRHASDVYRYALAVLRDPTDAEDVTQTVFLQAYRAYERGERPRKPHNWLIVIAKNTCRQWFRQLARRKHEVELEHDSLPAPLREGPRAGDIARGLQSLAPNHRAVLVMRELEGRSYAEIAETLGVSLAAVETLMFRARRAFREQLEGGLTCAEADAAVPRQLAGLLPRGEKRRLRVHLRECAECAARARSKRARRRLGGLSALPLPGWLLSLFGGGAAQTTATATTVGVTSSLMAKVAVVAGTATVAFGIGPGAVHHPPRSAAKPKPRPRRVVAPAAPARVAPVVVPAAAPAVYRPPRQSAVAVHRTASPAHRRTPRPVAAKPAVAPTQAAVAPAVPTPVQPQPTPHPKKETRKSDPPKLHEKVVAPTVVKHQSKEQPKRTRSEDKQRVPDEATKPTNKSPKDQPPPTEDKIPESDQTGATQDKTQPGSKHG